MSSRGLLRTILSSRGWLRPPGGQPSKGAIRPPHSHVPSTLGYERSPQDTSTFPFALSSCAQIHYCSFCSHQLFLQLFHPIPLKIPYPGTRHPATFPALPCLQVLRKEISNNMVSEKINQEKKRNQYTIKRSLTRLYPSESPPTLASEQRNAHATPTPAASWPACRPWPRRPWSLRPTIQPPPVSSLQPGEPTNTNLKLPEHIWKKV